MKLSFSPAAQEDLQDIADFIASGNPSRAMSFVEELERRCDASAQSPGIGTSRPEPGDGVRVWPHGRYLIFCREADKALRIERIMQGARDVVSDDIDA